MAASAASARIPVDVSASATRIDAADDSVVVSMTRERPCSYKIVYHNGKQYIIWLETTSGKKTTPQGLESPQWERLVPSIQRLMAASHQQHEHYKERPDLEDHEFTIDFGLETTISVEGSSQSLKLKDFDSIPIIDSTVAGGKKLHVMPISSDIDGAVFLLQSGMAIQLDEHYQEKKTRLLPELKTDQGKIEIIGAPLLHADKELAPTELDDALSVVDMNHDKALMILSTMTTIPSTEADLTAYFTEMKENPAFAAAQTVILPVQVKRKIGNKDITHYVTFIVDKQSRQLVYYDPTERATPVEPIIRNLAEAVRYNCFETIQGVPTANGSHPNEVEIIGNIGNHDASQKPPIAIHQSGRMIIALADRLSNTPVDSRGAKMPIKEIFGQFVKGIKGKAYSIADTMKQYVEQRRKEIQRRITSLLTGVSCDTLDLTKKPPANARAESADDGDTDSFVSCLNEDDEDEFEDARSTASDDHERVVDRMLDLHLFQ